MADETQDAWQRAQLLLEAQHAILKKENKPTVHPFDVPAAAIERAITDLMHYAHERNKGVPKGSGDQIDFEAILKLAKAQFIREREASPEKNETLLAPKPPEKKPPQLDDDVAIMRIHKELQYINAKDGIFTEAEKKRIAILEQTLNAEPALRKILAHMEARQEKERADLTQRQQASPRPDYGDAVRNLEERQRQERERYIREYNDAKVLREQLRSNEMAREENKNRTR